MSLDEVFLHDILAHPDDDAPRLIYADWLQEHDDEKRRDRGEFIVVQCRLERLEPGEERRDLVVRQRTLLRKYRDEWAGAWTQYTRQFAFGRGFLERVELCYQAIPLQTLDSLFQQHPAIRHLRYHGLDGEEANFIPRLLGLASLPDLHTLALDSIRNPSTTIDALISCEALVGLRRLFLEQTPIGDADVARLVGSPNLSSLHALRLLDSSIGPAGMASLAASPCLGELRYLSVGNSLGLTTEALLSLGQSTSLVSLTTLDLSCSWITPETLESFLAQPLARQLRRLLLNELNDDHARILVDTSALHGLEELRMSGHHTLTEWMQEQLRHRFANRLFWG